MQTHIIKCDDVHFDAIERGIKRFELRKNDRDYRTGDLLVLQRWDTQAQEFSRDKSNKIRTIKRTVAYMIKGGAYGLADDHVCMSI